MPIYTVPSGQSGGLYTVPTSSGSSTPTLGTVMYQPTTDWVDLTGSGLADPVDITPAVAAAGVVKSSRIGWNSCFGGALASYFSGFVPQYWDESFVEPAQQVIDGANLLSRVHRVITTWAAVATQNTWQLILPVPAGATGFNSVTMYVKGAPGGGVNPIVSMTVSPLNNVDAPVGDSRTIVGAEVWPATQLQIGDSDVLFPAGITAGQFISVAYSCAPDGAIGGPTTVDFSAIFIDWK